MIHDVSTDADDPPQFVALLDVRRKCTNGADYSGLRGAAHAQRYADLVPVVFTQSPLALYQGALAVAQASGWAVAAAVQGEGRIEATATTRLLRFKDDVVIRIRPHGEGSRIDIRSASRVGSSDLGANAKRIRTFLSELDNHLKTNS